MTTNIPEIPVIRILIAEDDPDDQLMLQDAFREVCPQCELHFVGDGVALLDYLATGHATGQQQLPGLLLLDLNMPLKDGRQALQDVRADPMFDGLPIVVLTTSNCEDDRRACLSAGADDYRVKPASYTELLNIVTSLQPYWTNHD